MSRADPTRTTTLRKQWEADFNKRWKSLASEIKTSVSTNNALALHVNEPMGERELEGDSLSEKVERFSDWLLLALGTYFLTRRYTFVEGEVRLAHWTDPYIRTAYERGMTRAAKEITTQTGLPVFPSPANPMSQPVHAEAVSLLKSRTFTGIKGITDDLSNTMSRVLAEGFSQNLTPAQISKVLLNEISRLKLGDLNGFDSLGRKVKAANRAKLLANTEISRAYNEAVLNVYEQTGVQTVKGMAEFVFTTAGDTKVCPICASLEGVTFSVKDARGVIPVHPMCRCTWVPIL